VIDTQLFLRATLNHRSLPAKLLFELGEYYVLAVSPGILDEVQDVLNRPKLRNKFTGLTDETVARTLTVLSGAQQVTPDMVPAVSRDPKDDIFLATAVTSGAQYLVTEDKDLLVLDPYQGIRIIDALAFLRIIQPSV
jgi:putative PIN family toxin of toxin-antitoxin system